MLKWLKTVRGLWDPRQKSLPEALSAAELGWRYPIPGAGLGCSVLPQGLPSHLPRGSCPAPDISICCRWGLVLQQPKGPELQGKGLLPKAAGYNFKAARLAGVSPKGQGWSSITSQVAQPACGWSHISYTGLKCPSRPGQGAARQCGF